MSGIEPFAIVVIAAHLLLVDVAMAGPLASAWLDWRGGRRGDEVAREVGRDLAIDSIKALVLGAVMGGVLLAIVWHSSEGRYAQTLSRMPERRWWFALAEIAFSLVCMVAVVALWRPGGALAIVRRALAVLAATNLIYHFPPLFAVLSIAGARPEEATTVWDGAAIRRLMFDGEVIARVVHVWLAAVAVTGLVVMARASGRARRSAEPALALAIVSWGARMALAPTLAQIFVGVWLVAKMSPAARDAVCGGDLLATLLLGAGVMAALGLMHLLSSVALGETDRRRVLATMMTMCVVVLLMTSLLRVVDRTALTSSPQLSQSRGEGDSPIFLPDPPPVSTPRKIGTVPSQNRDEQ